ncbi:MAG: TolC family protein [Planctomycetes bacterium]|nr:TolC family protein [Planctomycetota bacterium]
MRFICKSVGAVFFAALVSSCTSEARNARFAFEQVPEPTARALNEAARGPADAANPARTAAIPAISLAEILRLGELRSPGLAAAYHRWRGAVAEIGVAVELPEAMLEYFEAVEDRRSNIMLDSGKRGVMFTQPITNPGKLVAREKMLAADAGVMAEDFEVMRREVRRRTASAYYDIQALDARVEVSRQLVDLASGVEQSMEPMLSTGMATQADLLRMQVERAEVESDLASLNLRRAALVRVLVAASGVELLPAVAVDAPAPVKLPTKLPDRAHLFVAVEENPMLKMEHARSALARAQQVEANWMWVPDFVVGAGWMDMGDQMEGGTWSAVEVRAGVSIPWQFHVNKARSDAAAANEIAARLVVQQRRLDLMAELDAMLFELADAERMQKLYAADIGPKSRQAYDLVRSDFGVGKAKLTDVLGAQRTWLASELISINSRNEILKARAALSALTGLTMAGEGE